MTESMERVNAVCQRAGLDAELKAALLADPRGTLERETGMTIPAGWELAAVESADGSVSVELANDEIPEEYLTLVTGGLPPDSSEPSNC
jgi:hypothetical protein